jgi:hypothetical protein
MTGVPLQIVRTDGDESSSFVLNSQNLELILAKVPSGTKVAVISVVGELS